MAGNKNMTADEMYKLMDEAADRVADEPDSFREADVEDNLGNDDDAGNDDAHEDSGEGMDDSGGNLEGTDDDSEAGGEPEPDDEPGEEKIPDDAVGEDEGSANDTETDLESLIAGLDADDPRQNAIRSALGRVGSMQSTLDTLTQQIEILSASQPVYQDNQDNNDVSGADDLDTLFGEDDFIDSAADVARVIRKVNKAETEKAERNKQQYTNNFINTFLNDTKGMPEDQASELWTELVANHNRAETGNPVADCRIAVANSKAAILERRVEEMSQKGGEKKPNVRGGGKPEIPLGSSPQSKTSKSEKKVKRVRLDPEAAEFIKMMGMNEDEAMEYLSGETPANLQQR